MCMLATDHVYQMQINQTESSRLQFSELIHRF